MAAELLQTKGAWRAAWDAVGGLSKPSKMPGWSYGIPAASCKVGQILAKRDGSICEGCYAMKGAYVWSNVKPALQRRLESLRRDDWAESMISLLAFKYRAKSKRDRVFRWHDSGDLQGEWHLAKIVDVARALPEIRFWLPTREYGLVRRWERQHGAFPVNLVVRVSAPMFGGSAPSWARNTSTSGADSGQLCPVNREPGRKTCGTCRACWDPAVANVDYVRH